jgi:GxxExxY protein
VAKKSVAHGVYMEEFLYKDLTYKIIGCAMEVHKELGSGFLEKVYENALIIVLEENGLRAVSQTPLEVKYHGKIVGEYFVDIVVDDKVILELKAVSVIKNEHKAQIINYLTATGMKIGLILNFGAKSLEYERFIK